MRKKIVRKCIGILLLAVAGLSAQVPQLINYQGILNDPLTGAPIDTTQSMTFAIYAAATGGTPLWSETQNNVVIAKGYFSVMLGSVNPIAASVFDGADKFLGVKIGSDPEMTPRKRIASVGYAMKAGDTDKVAGQQLSSNDGSVNQSSDPVSWYKIKDMPAGFADGGDAVGLAGIAQVNVGTGMNVTNPTGPTTTLNLKMGHSNGIDADMVDGKHAGDFATASHNHWGEKWSGNGVGLSLSSNDNNGLYAYGSGHPAIYAESGGYQATRPGGNIGVYGYATDIGVFGLGTNFGTGGKSIDGDGVKGLSTNGNGVVAQSSNSHSLYIPNAGLSGVYVNDAGSHGVDVAHANGNGIQVYSAGTDGVRVVSTDHDGVHVINAKWSGVYVAHADGDALRVQAAGQDGLRFYEGVGRDYIRAGSDADLDFRVTNSGAAYADGGWQGYADFAELIEADARSSSFEPGDVLSISSNKDRAVVLSLRPYSTTVIGVYSTNPGFIGTTHPVEEKGDNEIPVAITGIVPCKVSTENGPIQRGDLLTTSSIPGFAMKATDPKIGTILGKAMESLESGKGKIEVLVMLQ